MLATRCFSYCALWVRKLIPERYLFLLQSKVLKSPKLKNYLRSSREYLNVTLIALDESISSISNVAKTKSYLI